jgi:hypothetical protein
MNTDKQESWGFPAAALVAVATLTGVGAAFAAADEAPLYVEVAQVARAPIGYSLPFADWGIRMGHDSRRLSQRRRNKGLAPPKNGEGPTIGLRAVLEAWRHGPTCGAAGVRMWPEQHSAGEMRR